MSASCPSHGHGAVAPPGEGEQDTGLVFKKKKKNKKKKKYFKKITDTEWLGKCSKIFHEASVLRSQTNELAYLRDALGCRPFHNLLHLLEISGHTCL